MKLDIMKIVQLVGMGMQVADRVKAGHGGAEKAAAAIAEIQDKVPQIEEVVGVDFVNDENLNKLLHDAMAANVALRNGIEAAKGLRPKPPMAPE